VSVLRRFCGSLLQIVGPHTRKLRQPNRVERSRGTAMRCFVWLFDMLRYFYDCISNDSQSPLTQSGLSALWTCDVSSTIWTMDDDHREWTVRSSVSRFICRKYDADEKASVSYNRLSYRSGAICRRDNERLNKHGSINGSSSVTAADQRRLINCVTTVQSARLVHASRL